MIRELRRFVVRDAAGEPVSVSEVASFLQVDGVEVMDGVPTLFTADGTEIFSTGTPGESRVGTVLLRRVEP